MNHQKKAESLFLQGYNCCQSVFCAFADEFGMDFDTALRLSSSFGGGMGRLREVCGAVSAMFMIAGLPTAMPTRRTIWQKQSTMSAFKPWQAQFKEKHGSIICRDLLGLEGAQSPVPEARTKQYYQKRPCAEFVKYAAKLLEDYLGYL